MEHATSIQKTPQTATSNTNPDTSAGLQGSALTPPAYGIDMADRQPIQGGDAAIQRQAPAAVRSAAPATPAIHRTGLPDALKAGVERLSGIAMDDVKVHYNSSKPAQLRALAYTQSTDIHVAPRQERHLPHEAWHVVQQKQGRVRPMTQLKGTAINDDSGLEREADVIGTKAARHSALQMKQYQPIHTHGCSCPSRSPSQPIQRLKDELARGDIIFL